MNARLMHRNEWSASLKDAMFDLLAAHFVGVSRVQFECDMADKNWAVLLEDSACRLVGFSTFALYRTAFHDQSMTVVCSGDTIVDRSRPTSTALLRCWIQSVLQLHAPYSSDPMYWLLIVSGFRTYRFLPVFWREFVPRYDQPAHASTLNLMHHLATERFGRAYDSAEGIVRFDRPQVLRADLNGIPCGRLADPHVRYFAEQNPGHEHGDELVCLTRVHRSNLTASGLRMAEAEPRRRSLVGG